MNNLFDKIGSDLKNFSPEAPAYMEERIQKAVMSQKSKVRFWFSLNAVLLLVGITAASVYLINQNSSETTAQLANVQATKAPQVADVSAASHAVQPAVGVTTVSHKSSGNLSATRTVTTPVIKETCAGTPAVVELQASNTSTENTVQVQEVSNVKEEVIKPEEVPVKKRRSLPITRLHIQK